MQDADLFPDHPCPLARIDNSTRCASAKESTPTRCARCKTGMAGLLGEALHNGDRSLALMLMPPQLRDRGFSLETHEGPCHAPVFELARDATAHDAQDACFIVPEDAGTRFEVLLVGEGDTERRMQQLTLNEAVAVVQGKSSSEQEPLLPVNVPKRAKPSPGSH